MKKTLVFFLLLHTLQFWGQDTIPYKFYDKDFRTTLKAENAAYFCFTEFDHSIEQNNLITYDRNGKIRKYERFSVLSRSILDGVTEELSENGKVVSQTNYRNNLKHGKLLRYWPDETLKREENYIDNKFIDGKCYDANGKEINFFPYYIRASFPGGIPKFYDFLSRNINKSLIKENGRLYIQFKIETTGAISNIKIVRGFGNEKLNSNVISVIKKSPYWIPSSIDGELVEELISIPMNFSKGSMNMSVDEILEERMNSNYKSQLIKF
ncbi:energy transducer TonB [Flavobacterium sp.]|uniref:energy transducer TonB n=1 Tax=Flavobacterium sp. TaxID=239 RepID=UPI002605A06C|nr:energy transducer TonB [Flavobacterium sp.]MDD3004145.1 energy transducer TonB [Flavobacterium sp.]